MLNNNLKGEYNTSNGAQRPEFSIEKFTDRPTRSQLKGRGVGDDIQAGRSIKLSRKLQDRYNVMNCYDQHPEEVYIMNKILKDLIQNT